MQEGVSEKNPEDRTAASDSPASWTSAFRTRCCTGERGLGEGDTVRGGPGAQGHARGAEGDTWGHTNGSTRPSKTPLFTVGLPPGDDPEADRSKRQPVVPAMIRAEEGERPEP